MTFGGFGEEDIEAEKKNQREDEDEEGEVGGEEEEEKPDVKSRRKGKEKGKDRDDGNKVCHLCCGSLLHHRLTDGKKRTALILDGDQHTSTKRPRSSPQPLSKTFLRPAGFSPTSKPPSKPQSYPLPQPAGLPPQQAPLSSARFKAEPGAPHRSMSAADRLRQAIFASRNGNKPPIPPTNGNEVKKRKLSPPTSATPSMRIELRDVKPDLDERERELKAQRKREKNARKKARKAAAKAEAEVEAEGGDA